jgi:hypothetical protein
MEGWIMTDIRTSGLGGIPKGNTANRSIVFPSPQLGDTYYNGEIVALEIYNGTAWKVIRTEGFPPDAPTISSVTDSSTSLAYSSTAGTLDVVFVPAGTGGTPTQYNAYTTTGGHSAFTTVGNTVTITGLTPGTAYSVYGNAQNGSGTSTNTANFNPVAPTTLPQVPIIGTATVSSSASEATVTWTLGNDGAKSLTSITITPYLNGTTAETSRTAATTSSTSYTFTTGQLTAGANYTFKVKATNANGTSNESAATNSVTIPVFVNFETLIVAGGGGGGSTYHGGGGGGGGAKDITFTAQKGITYNVVVGSGGAGGTANGDGRRGSQGGPSSIFGISTTGGGGGASYGESLNGGNGGSGGGGSQGASGPNNGGTGISGEGNNGGSPTSSVSWMGGSGGGGKNSVGGNGSGNSNASGSIAGAGGDAFDWKSLGTFYAGGGSGSYGTGGTSASPGTNAGQGSNAQGGDAVQNRGGGGGGSERNHTSTIFYRGGNGGSGIVILRTSGSYNATSVTGSPQRSESGGYTYYTFNGDGSITV